MGYVIVSRKEVFLCNELSSKPNGVWRNV